MTNVELVQQEAKIRETSEQRFRRVATRRTRLILRYLRLLGNTANRQAYKSSEAEIEAIFSAIEKAVADTKSKFLHVDEEEFALR